MKYAQRLPLALFAAGVVMNGYAYFTAPERAWSNLLVDGFFVASLGISAAFFAATQRLSGARWSAGLRRIPEALMLTLPIGAVLLGAVFLGRHALYPWAAPGGLDGEPAFAGKHGVLQAPFFLARMVVIFAIWIAFAWSYRRISLAEDRDPGAGARYARRLDRWAGIFVPVFALTFTVAASDWLLSLEPHWSSTLFAVYVFAGMFVQGIAALTLATVALQAKGLLDDEAIGASLHDLGKLLFAFSTFWAYLWVCQYLLIWYGNIPDEVGFYAVRTSEAWLPVFLANLAVNWILPFTILLSARAKRTPGILAGVSVLLLCGRWLDLYLLVMPAKSAAPELGPIEIVMAIGCFALVYLSVVGWLFRAPLVPLLARQRRAPCA